MAKQLYRQLNHQLALHGLSITKKVLDRSSKFSRVRTCTWPFGDPDSPMKPIWICLKRKIYVESLTEHAPPPLTMPHPFRSSRSSQSHVIPPRPSGNTFWGRAPSFRGSFKRLLLWDWQPALRWTSRGWRWKPWDDLTFKWRWWLMSDNRV